MREVGREGTAQASPLPAHPPAVQNDSCCGFRACDSKGFMVDPSVCVLKSVSTLRLLYGCPTKYTGINYSAVPNSSSNSSDDANSKVFGAMAHVAVRRYF